MNLNPGISGQRELKVLLWKLLVYGVNVISDNLRKRGFCAKNINDRYDGRFGHFSFLLKQLQNNYLYLMQQPLLSVSVMDPDLVQVEQQGQSRVKLYQAHLLVPVSKVSPVLGNYKKACQEK